MGTNELVRLWAICTHVTVPVKAATIPTIMTEFTPISTASSKVRCHSTGPRSGWLTVAYRNSTKRPKAAIGRE